MSFAHTRTSCLEHDLSRSLQEVYANIKLLLDGSEQNKKFFLRRVFNNIPLDSDDSVLCAGRLQQSEFLSSLTAESPIACGSALMIFAWKIQTYIICVCVVAAVQSEISHDLTTDLFWLGFAVALFKTGVLFRLRLLATKRRLYFSLRSHF